MGDEHRVHYAREPFRREPDFGVTSAEETDLMERPAKTLTIESGGVKVETKPFEIKTVRLGPAGTQVTSGEAGSKP